jgi:SAM-dependent methyltransferase
MMDTERNGMPERRGGDFSGLSGVYQRHRPDYPAELTAAGAAFLAEGGRTADAGLLVIDVGAGTGISTRAWRRALGRECRIVGIEPGEDMRREAVAATAPEERIEYRPGAAEALPVGAGEAGLVAAAQAAHWFDRKRFYAEADRVLGPAGVLAFMANNRDWTASAFLDRYEALLEAHSSGYRRDYRGVDFVGEFARLPWIEATAIHRHRWSRRLAPAELEGLLLSSSLAQRAAAAMGGDRFAAAVAELIAEAAGPDGRIEFPYVGDIQLARKRRAGS